MWFDQSKVAALDPAAVGGLSAANEVDPSDAGFDRVSGCADPTAMVGLIEQMAPDPTAMADQSHGCADPTAMGGLMRSNGIDPTAMAG